MQSRLNNSLIRAVHRGDLETVMNIVNSYGFSYRPAWSEGYFVLRTAIKDERPEIAKFLLRKGAKTNGKSTMRGGTKSNTLLHYAVTNTTDVELVEMLLDRNAFIDAHNDRDETPLYLAIYSWKKYFVRLLLDRGANVNVKSRGETPLQTAMVRYDCFKDPELIEMLLNKNASVEEKNWRVTSPLHMAASEGYETCVRLFLDRKADVNVLDDSGVTPLFGACFKGFPNIVELLLNAGASCEQSERSGISPLHLTSLINNKKIMCLLIDKVHDINAIAATDLDHLRHYDFKLSVHEMSGCAPLHIACKKGYIDVVNLLLSKSANVNLINKDNETPLHLAVKKQSLPLIQRVLEYNPDVVDENNIAALRTAVCADGGINLKISDILIDYGFFFSSKDMDNPELLHAAVKKGLKKLVHYILTSGVDFKSSLGSCTLLHTAVQFGCKETVKLLIDAGCNVNAKDDEGKTPIDIFMGRFHRFSNSVEVAKLLLDSITGIRRPNIAAFLLKAVKKESFELCEVLVDYFGADVNFVDDCDKTPLLYLCENSCSQSFSQSCCSEFECTFNESMRKKIAELLLKHGAKVNVGTSIGKTALHMASSKGCEGLVHLLLEHGADINAVTSDGASSLHMAISGGHRKIVELLVSSGANVNAFSRYDGTPLHIAASKEDTVLVELLLRHDADINQQDSLGKTVLHIASEMGLESFVNFLLENGADVNIMCNQGNTALNVAKNRVPSSNYQGKSRRRNKSYWFDEDSYQYREHRRYSDDHEYEAHRYEDHYDDEDYEDDFVDQGGDDFVYELDCFCHQLEHTTREALQLHIIKLNVAGLFVCMKNLKDFPFSKLDWFQDNCRKEINAIKKEKLCCHIERSRNSEFELFEGIPFDEIDEYQHECEEEINAIKKEKLCCHVKRSRNFEFELFEGIPFDEIDKYQYECEEEINAMKDVKFCCRTTVDYFLLPNRRLTYLNDEKLVETFESFRFNSFPIYRSVLESNFKYDKQRIKLLMSSCEWFLTLIKTRNALHLSKLTILPMEIIEKILLHLNNGTLKNVISCGEQLRRKLKKPLLPVLSVL